MRYRISRRDKELLERIVALGHFTFEVLRRWYPKLSASAIRSWIKRLRQAGWIISAPLDDRHNYYRLSGKAIVFLKERGVRVSRASTRPLKPNRKPEKHALLLFVSDSTSGFVREAYRPAFDAIRFPELVAQLAEGKADPYRQRLFYRVANTIGLFVLDRGHPDFVNNKLRPQVEDLWNQPSFVHIVESGHFELTVATASAMRKQELDASIRKNPPGFHWHIIVMEEVAAILPRCTGSKQPHSQKESDDNE